jgi:hypothetical protein
MSHVLQAAKDNEIKDCAVAANVQHPRKSQLKMGNKRIDALKAENTSGGSLHPAWLALIRYCRELRHGELERLSIHGGVPVIAEHVRQKVKFKS